MADLNTTYTGTSDVQDPDVVIAKLPGVFFWDAKKDIYLPDEVRQQIRQTNADAVSTTDAVKVPYKGTTSAERLQWINDRITAISNRVSFIKTRTDALLDGLQRQSQDSYNSVVKVVTSALSLLPGVGTVVAFTANQAQAAQTLEQYKTQQLLQAYADDLTQLANIRNQLLKELASIDPNATDPPAGAPAPWPWWYYAVGAGLLILLLVWIRRRNQKRKR